MEYLLYQDFCVKYDKKFNSYSFFLKILGGSRRAKKFRSRTGFREDSVKGLIQQAVTVTKPVPPFLLPSLSPLCLSCSSSKVTSGRVCQMSPQFFGDNV
jgi:hypothetical protein